MATSSVSSPSTSRLRRSVAATIGADLILCVSFSLLYGLAANIPFWIASGAAGFIPCGGLCGEYLVVGMMALFIPRRIASALLLLAIGADTLSATSRTYSLPPLDCLTNIGFVASFNPARLAGFAAVLVFALLVAAAAASFPVKRIPRHKRHRTALCLAFILTSGLAKDYLVVARLTGRFPDPFRLLPPTDGVRVETRPVAIFRRPSIQLVQEQAAFGEIERMESRDSSRGNSVANASHLAFNALGSYTGQESGSAPNLVLILVESWGFANDLRLRTALIAPYLQPDISARYQVLNGVVAFHGSTVSGESRELCGQDLGFRILSGSAEVFRNCLPERLKARGYYDIAAHGNSGYFFRRTDWYERIGFDEKMFRPDFQRLGLPDCAGTSLGTCDSDVAEWIGKQLEAPRANPLFVYWVTLNSHLPLPPVVGGDCAASRLLSNDRGFCTWSQRISKANRAIAAVVTENSPRPTVFAIVGDHIPPFTDPSIRGLFSPATVPYVVLIPRPTAP